MKRLFLAVKIIPDDKLLTVYQDIKEKCRLSKIKWVDDHLFHITLKFFGETPEFKIDDIIEVMENVSLLYKPFSFELKGVGVFGSSYRPRVIWFGVINHKRLVQLNQELLTLLEERGFKNDRQNFVPHLTVGRIKYIQDKVRLKQIVEQYQNISLQQVEVNKIILYESVLAKKGPQYFPVHEVLLKDSMA